MSPPESDCLACMRVRVWFPEPMWKFQVRWHGGWWHCGRKERSVPEAGFLASQPTVIELKTSDPSQWKGGQCSKNEPPEVVLWFPYALICAPLPYPPK